MRFMIDDERTVIPGGSAPDFIITNGPAAMLLIESGWMAPMDSLYLDHDLGHEKIDGHSLICRIEELWNTDSGWAKYNIPRHIYCVSDNPQGRLRIEQGIANVKKIREEYEVKYG